MDAIENEVRRAFALAINLYNHELRPDASEFGFDLIRGHHYELRASVGGYTFIGRYYSAQENSEILVDVTIREVIHPDTSKRYPHFHHSANKANELGDNYAERYIVEG